MLASTYAEGVDVGMLAGWGVGGGITERHGIRADGHGAGTTRRGTWLKVHSGRPCIGRRTFARRSTALVIAAMAVTATSVAEAGTDTTEPPTDDAAATTVVDGDFLSASMANATAHEQIPTEILTTDPITPIEDATIYNIACDQSLVGCSVIAGYIRTGVEALGWTYELCDAGASPQEATSCFDNAINAGADAIITNAVGVNVAGNGYAAADEAGIPIVAIFSGNGEGAPGVVTEVGETACPEQGAIVADYIISSTEGDANTLFVTERSIGCNNQRTDGFLAAMEQCESCSAETLEFDRATMDANLSRQITAAIQANPDLDYIVGVFGAPTLIAATAVADSGRDISVAGLDGDPANIELIRQGDVMQAAIAFGRGEAAWAGVDAIARTLSDGEVQSGTAVPILLINDSNVDQLPGRRALRGPGRIRGSVQGAVGCQLIEAGGASRSAIGRLAIPGSAAVLIASK